MGDTGSMLLGFSIFMLAVMCYELVGLDELIMVLPALHSPQAGAMLLLSLLFLPIYDAIRVFILRASKGISPLRADRSHIHYYLLDAGFTHTGAVAVIAITNIALVLVTWLLQDM